MMRANNERETKVYINKINWNEQVLFEVFVSMTNTQTQKARSEITTKTFKEMIKYYPDLTSNYIKKFVPILLHPRIKEPVEPVNPRSHWTAGITMINHVVGKGMIMYIKLN